MRIESTFMLVLNHLRQFDFNTTSTNLPVKISAKVHPPPSTILTENYPIFKNAFINIKFLKPQKFILKTFIKMEENVLTPPPGSRQLKKKISHGNSLTSPPLLESRKSVNIGKQKICGKIVPRASKFTKKKGVKILAKDMETSLNSKCLTRTYKKYSYSFFQFRLNILI